MNESVLTTETKEGVVWLTLNRPQVMNSLNFELLHSLRDRVEALRFDPAIRVVVIRGAGEKAFCAGADLKERATLAPAAVKTYIHTIRNTFSAIERLPKVVIAAVLYLGEEGISPSGNILYDAACSAYLPLEDLILVGEYLSASLQKNKGLEPPSGTYLF